MKHEEKRKSLYVASHDYTSLTKVGVAIDPTTRVAQLKHQAGAELKIYYESTLTENYFRIEQQVLNHFKDKRIFGEWINEPPEKIIEYIKTIEHEFESEDYACLHCLFEDYTGEEVKEGEYYLSNYKVDYSKLRLDKHNIYVSEDYKFYVFVQQSNIITEINFNIYKTAKKFATQFKERLVTFNKETKEFNKNPNFSIKNG
jgi:hypothetical protein